eukprot:jgi/Orpsp1_1/1192916/evm.model.d7180000096901.1
MKSFKRIFNVILTAIAVSASYIPSSTSSDDKLSELIKNSHRILNPSNYNINPNTQLNALLPSSFDLRDVDGMNFISPVKYQGNSGWCWVFSNVAAAEASAQYELWDEYGISPDDLPLDFSELQMGWFAYTALQANETDYPAQKGEGIYFDDNINILDKGGNQDIFISLLASGIGPSDEKKTPFTSKSGNTVWVKVDKNGKVLKDKNGNFIQEIHPLNWKGPSNFKPYYLITKGEDWTVDLKKRFNSKLRLEHANNLPCPAIYDKKGNYQFDQNGVDAIKQELNRGHAVNIKYHSNNNKFDDLNDPPIYLNKKYGHYTYNVENTNHEVIIVGYDDNYSKKKLRQVDKKGNKIDPPANGAFICKNSWGSKYDKFYKDREFGVDGTGYFYLSYYDKSLHNPTSYDFSLVELVENDEDIIPVIDQHDLLPSIYGWSNFKTDDKVVMSNIFTPGRDEILEAISTNVFVPNTIVEYAVYKLNYNYTNPIDGTLVASGSQSVIYSGFHLFELKTPIEIASTESYSIVIKQKDSNDNNIFYFGFTRSFNKKFYDIYNPLVKEKEEKLKSYSVAILNKGESFLGKNDIWIDQTRLAKSYKKVSIAHPTDPNLRLIVENGYTIDNFPIKGYAVIEK